MCDDTEIADVLHERNYLILRAAKVSVLHELVMINIAMVVCQFEILPHYANIFKMTHYHSSNRIERVSKSPMGKKHKCPKIIS
jgi:hypothetical protein